MIRKDINRKQEPLRMAGLVFAGVFFVDIATRQFMGKQFDVLHSTLFSLVLGFAYFIFAMFNNKRVKSKKGGKT